MKAKKDDVQLNEFWLYLKLKRRGLDENGVWLNEELNEKLNEKKKVYWWYPRDNVWVEQG